MADASNNAQLAAATLEGPPGLADQADHVGTAATVGVATPVNAAVLEVARRIESGELEPGPDNLRLMLDLAGS